MANVNRYCPLWLDSYYLNLVYHVLLSYAALRQTVSLGCIFFSKQRYFIFSSPTIVFPESFLPQYKQCFHFSLWELPPVFLRTFHTIFFIQFQVRMRPLFYAKFLSIALRKKQNVTYLLCKTILKTTVKQQWNLYFFSFILKAVRIQVQLCMLALASKGGEKKKNEVKEI